MLSQIWTALSLFVVAASLRAADARELSRQDIHARQLEAAKRWHSTRSSPAKRAAPKNITFSNPKASQFYVDGRSIPEVDFDVGPSWSGLMPISGNPKETRKLFFWFFPPGPDGRRMEAQDAHPLRSGARSMQPFSWSWGQAKPTVNDFSWTNLANVLWVEQPVGTGYSQGTPNIKNEDELAAQLVGFMQQFLEVFSELKNKNLYMSGESFAGTMLPYTANYIYQHPKELDLKLKGIWIADPSLSWNVVQEQIPAVNFVHRYEHVFAFNQTFLAQLDALSKKCNYAGYMDKHVTYPPKNGLLPLPGKSTTADRGCDVWNMIFNEALRINPAFNVYRIFDTYPILWDVLGFPGSFEQVQVAPVYFDRADVKKAIHAPANVTWSVCSPINVFPRGDSSLPPALTVLPSVIEKNIRTVIVHGLADFRLLAEG
ncbi:hypothetical protein H0H81_004589 [Sphagnurus paluster]|uniref:Serine carboxypeptidase n=1 Tax=Sphagnurus paluster TaxID=117069 RepID=A0A9P7FUE1_9AGAR|nr:hypothetical protein H0H81_004589 [Sphagnurus paluster]